MIELLVGLLMTACLAPVVRTQVLRLGLVDVPNHRSSHTLPTPRAGGIACLAAVLAAALAAELMGSRPSWPVVAAATVLALVGLGDDHSDLPPWVRLVAQLGAGGATGLALGGPWLALAGLLVVPAFVNAVNFMDGINGMTALTMAVWGGNVLAVGRDVGSDALAGLGGATAGVALGFLPFNVPSARMFLGDVGSYLLGALAGGGLLLGWAEGAPILVLAAPMAIYAADTSVALLRRAARGERLLDAHREHVYQQLTSDAKLPHPVVAAFAAGLAAATALAWGTMPVWLAGTATVLACFLYLISPNVVRAARARY